MAVRVKTISRQPAAITYQLSHNLGVSQSAEIQSITPV